MKRIPQCHLQHDLVSVQDKGGRSVIYKMKLGLSQAGKCVELGLELGLETLRIRRRRRRGMAGGGSRRRWRGSRDRVALPPESPGAAGAVLARFVCGFRCGGNNFGFTKVKLRAIGSVAPPSARPSVRVGTLLPIASRSKGFSWPRARPNSFPSR